MTFARPLACVLLALGVLASAWGQAPAPPPRDGRVAQAEPEAEPAPAVPAPAEPTDEQQLATLVADLTRYGTLGEAELRREAGVVTQALNRQRSDANRIRLAVLHTLSRNPQDDQRALQLLEVVVKNNPGSPSMKQLALVLQVQIAERVRAVRDEQAKANDAIQKLEALRAMERSLLRDRVRGGGGGAGAGAGGGG